MRALIIGMIDRLVKQRRIGSHSLYLLGRRLVSAYENSDVDMATNGEYWLLRQLSLFPNFIAIDVGANIGEWTAGLLREIPNARVYSYEPVPATFDKLQEHIRSTSATLVNEALGSRIETVPLHSVVDNSYLSTLQGVDDLAKDGMRIEQIEVRCSTGDFEIDRFGLKHVNFLKVDAEGHDLEVVKGFSKGIESGIVDFIQFEYNQTSLAAGVMLRHFFQILFPRYLICRLLPAGLEACGYHGSMENFAQTNWLALKRSMVDRELVERLSIRPARGISGQKLAQLLHDDPDLRNLLGMRTK